MFAIEEAKLPPPTPANVATISSVVNETPGSRKIADQDRRDQQQQRADDRPVAAAELRDGEGVRQPQDGARQRGQRGEQELAGRVDAVLGAEEQHDHRPQAPHREPDVLGEDREDQVALGDRRALCCPRTPGPPGASRRSSACRGGSSGRSARAAAPSGGRGGWRLRGGAIGRHGRSFGSELDRPRCRGRWWGTGFVDAALAGLQLVGWSGRTLHRRRRPRIDNDVACGVHLDGIHGQHVVARRRAAGAEVERVQVQRAHDDRWRRSDRPRSGRRGAGRRRRDRTTAPVAQPEHGDLLAVARRTRDPRRRGSGAAARAVARLAPCTAVIGPAPSAAPRAAARCGTGRGWPARRPPATGRR